MLQTFAEIFRPLECDDAEMAFEAIASVDPGGHFFGCEHTMARYKSAFYEPAVSAEQLRILARESGASPRVQRANGIWKDILAEFTPPEMDPARFEELQAFVQTHSRGGACRQTLNTYKTHGTRRKGYLSHLSLVRGARVGSAATFKA